MNQQREVKMSTICTFREVCNMKLTKNKKYNSLSESCSNSVLHPYVKSSFNFVNEDFDDNVEEIGLEDVPETPEPGVETGYSNMLINAINGEWDTIELYNSIIATLSLEKDKKYDAIIKILQDITNEENIHVGQLQKALEILSPNTSLIKDGEKEADEQISADDYDDITEGLLLEDAEESDDENQVQKSEQDDDTKEGSEEKSPKEKIKEMLENSKNPTYKDVISIEKMLVYGSDDSSKDILVSAIGENDEIEPAELVKFEDTAKNLGTKINIGDIARKYGMKSFDVINQTTSSSLNPEKQKIILFSLLATIIKDAQKHIDICKNLLEKTYDNDVAEKVLETMEKMESFTKE